MYHLEVVWKDLHRVSDAQRLQVLRVPEHQGNWSLTAATVQVPDHYYSEVYTVHSYLLMACSVDAVSPVQL